MQYEGGVGGGVNDQAKIRDTRGTATGAPDGVYVNNNFSTVVLVGFEEIDDEVNAEQVISNAIAHSHPQRCCVFVQKCDGIW